MTVPLDDVCLGMDNEPAAETVLRESLDRGMTDQQLVEEMAATKFTGSQYERFANELSRYGIEVLKAWMRSGEIFVRTAAAHGHGLNPTGFELEDLHRDADARDQLATMTVATALPRFREQALVNGGWRFDGGASLKTYFMGACLGVFANEFRKRRGAQRRRARDRPWSDEEITNFRDNTTVTDPAVIAVRTMTVRERLQGRDPQTQAIVLYDSYGYTHKEISDLITERFGEKSVRAIEGVLHRWRQQNSSRGHEGGDQP